jgi:hypothetical protein
MIDGERILCHVLAWFYTHGVWPADQLDHINGDKSDNRIDNLRIATASQNKANSGPYRNNPTGLKGAYWYKPLQMWVSKIRKDGKLHHLGYFATAEEAHTAYCEAAKRLHGEFARAA